MSIVTKASKNGVLYDIRDPRVPDGAVFDEEYLIELTGSSEPTQEQLRYIWEHKPARIHFHVDDSKDAQDSLFFLNWYEAGWRLVYVCNEGKEILRLAIDRDKDHEDQLEYEIDEYELDGGEEYEIIEDSQVDALFPDWRHGYVPGDDDDDDDDDDEYDVSWSFDHVTTTYDSHHPNQNGMLQMWLTADEHYYIDNVYVTMGGDDVTASAWNPNGDGVTGSVYIRNVTGDVQVTASAIYNDSETTYQVHINTDGNSWVTLYDTYNNEVHDGDWISSTSHLTGHADYDYKNGYTGVDVTINVGSQDVTSQCYEPDKQDINIWDIDEDVFISTTATSK